MKHRYPQWVQNVTERLEESFACELCGARRRVFYDETRDQIRCRVQCAQPWDPQDWRSWVCEEAPQDTQLTLG